MTIGEALTLRSDMERRIRELRERIDYGVLVQEGEESEHDPQAMLVELLGLATEREQLIVLINQANMRVRLEDGRTLMEAIARRDALGSQHQSLMLTAAAASRRGHRYMRSELRMVSLVSASELYERAARLARERRELDALIQAANWTHTLDNGE